MKSRFAVFVARKGFEGYLTAPKAADVVYRQTSSCYTDHQIDAWRFSTESEAREVADAFLKTLYNPKPEDVTVVPL